LRHPRGRASATTPAQSRDAFRVGLRHQNGAVDAVDAVDAVGAVGAVGAVDAVDAVDAVGAVSLAEHCHVKILHSLVLNELIGPRASGRSMQKFYMAWVAPKGLRLRRQRAVGNNAVARLRRKPGAAVERGGPRARWRDQCSVLRSHWRMPLRAALRIARAKPALPLGAAAGLEGGSGGASARRARARRAYRDVVRGEQQQLLL
jgi:hypothetical protein